MKRAITFLLFTLFVMSMSAYDFKSGNFYYNITSSNTVEVTYQEDWPSDNYLGLTFATIPETVTYNDITYSVTSIGDHAFNRSSLTSVVISEGVKRVGEWAFANCRNLASVAIPSSLVSIDDNAFLGAKALTSIVIPNSVTSIGIDILGGCPNLSSIEVMDGNSVYDSREGCNAIIETSTNTLVVGCKNTIIPNSVTDIAWFAFDGSGLTSLVIPNSVTSIGVYAFADCQSLDSITIPNSVERLTAPLFSFCTELTSIVVEEGNGVYDSREDCNAIIETSTNTLVAGCKSTIIPNTVTSIGVDAFWSCTPLEYIHIPNTITSIGERAFVQCGLKYLTIPNSVVNIGSQAFDLTPWLGSQSDGLVYINKVLYDYKGSMPSGTSIDIKEGTVSVSGYAFYDYPQLESISIPNSVTNIGSYAFYNCSNLASVICEGATPPLLEGYNIFNSSPICYIPCGTKAAYEASDWAQYVSEFVEEDCPEPIDPTWQITYTSTDGNIVTPHATDAFGAKIISNTYENGVGTITFDGPVTSIGDLAFYSCTSITSIAIPNGVTSIGQYAFRDCSFLISITIPNSITSIGWGAFQSCSTLTSITIPNNVTSIGKQAFWDCSKLTSITIPNSVTSIGDHAFYRCTSLVSVAIGNSVESIEWGTFQYCYSLTSIVIPESVTSIGYEAFFGSSLTSITIPNSVTSIGEYAFRSCSLTSITIPNSITSIGYRAFLNCSYLDSIYVEATTPPALGYEALEETSSPICYIPCGTKAAYEASDWAQYVSEFVEDCDNGSYSRNVRIGYNTICLPHGSSHFTGATFYEIAHILKNKKKIFFDEVKTLEAGKPYIFYPHSNEVTIYYDNTTSAIPLSHNGLHGTFDGITAASNFLKGKYLVAGDRMVLCGDGCSLAANRAYIVLDEISDKDHPAIPGIKRVSMDYSEENATTALDNITDESIVAPMQEGVYDILGRKVDAPTVSGFYIINGKKVFVK